MKRPSKRQQAQAAAIEKMVGWFEARDCGLVASVTLPVRRVHSSSCVVLLTGGGMAFYPTAAGLAFLATQQEETR